MTAALAARGDADARLAELLAAELECGTPAASEFPRSVAAERWMDELHYAQQRVDRHAASCDRDIALIRAAMRAVGQ